MRPRFSWIFQNGIAFLSPLKEMQINVFPMASLVFLCMDFGIAK